MPIYQYVHTAGVPSNCEEVIEVTQRMSEPALDKCPACGRKVHRIITSVAGHIDNLGGAALREKGFKKFVRRDKGAYEEA
jgi:putative FmdB family regulatory protein